MRGKAQKREKRTIGLGVGQALDSKGRQEAVFLNFDERTEQIFQPRWKMHKPALANALAEMVK